MITSSIRMLSHILGHQAQIDWGFFDHLCSYTAWRDVKIFLQESDDNVALLVSKTGVSAYQSTDAIGDEKKAEQVSTLLHDVDDLPRLRMYNQILFKFCVTHDTLARANIPETWKPFNKTKTMRDCGICFHQGRPIYSQMKCGRIT